MTNKRKDECQFCMSRSCYHRCYRKEDPKYDEVFCNKHIEIGYKTADSVLGINNGISRVYSNGTGKMRRGE